MCVTLGAFPATIRTMAPAPLDPPPRQLVAAFAVIYVGWGSTFLAIRYAVDAIPPFVMAGTRNLAAGLVLVTLGLASGAAIQARLGGQEIDAVDDDDPVWLPIVDTLAGLCHNIVCSTGPLRIAMGGGVMTRQPHLLAKIEARLIESLGGYMQLPQGTAYIVSPALGAHAGPLGSIALGLAALHPAVGVVGVR